MRIGLMESERKRERHESGMVPSVVVHAVVIGLVWYGTAGAHVLPRGKQYITVVPLPTLPAAPTPTRHGGAGSSGGLTAPPAIPDHLPPIPVGPVTVPVSTVSWDSVVAAPNWGSGRGATGQTGAASSSADGVFRTVDVMAVPDARNPAPVYPSMLRDAGLEGSISARFVVDTTGRIVTSSIAFLGGGNALFEQSVRQALEAARFSPALVNGHPVRVLMAQAFAFRLQR